MRRGQEPSPRFLRLRGALRRDLAGAFRRGRARPLTLAAARLSLAAPRATSRGGKSRCARWPYAGAAGRFAEEILARLRSSSFGEVAPEPFGRRRKPTTNEVCRRPGPAKRRPPRFPRLRSFCSRLGSTAASLEGPAPSAAPYKAEPPVGTSSSEPVRRNLSAEPPGGTCRRNHASEPGGEARS